MDTQQYIEVLLIEDRIEDAELAMDSLREGGLINKIQWIKDGQEALDYLFSEGKYKNTSIEFPKLIFLDLKLPKVSGMEVLKRLKMSEKHKHLSVVVMTSSKEDRDIKMAYSLGANSYIVKPVNFDGFSKAVREVGFYWLVLNTSPKD